MLRFRPLPMLTLMTLAALVVLIMFGRWQWDKYQAETHAEQDPPLEVTLSDYQPIAEGIQLVYGAMDGVPGWRVLTPVQSGGRIIFVDAAHVTGVDAPDWRTQRVPGSLSHGVAVTGIAVSPAAAGAFANAPEPALRVWYAIDLTAMAQAAGLSGEVAVDEYIALPYVGEDGRPRPNPFVLGRMDSTPPAQHLGYAITWWGLALVLMGVYFAYHASAGRLRFGREAG
jgi:surfeit locus 1 family protein